MYSEDGTLSSLIISKSRSYRSRRRPIPAIPALGRAGVFTCTQNRPGFCNDYAPARKPGYGLSLGCLFAIRDC